MAYGKKVKLWRTPDEYGEFEPLTEQKIERLKERAMNYCVWSLGNSMKTRKQLADKMRMKNCPEDIAELTLNRLEEMHLLNDLDYAESYARSRTLSGKGERKVLQDLKMKGISEDILATLFEDSDPDDEELRAKELARKRIRSTAKLERQKRVQRLVGYLARNGYSAGTAFKVINELLDEEATEEEEDDS